MLESIDEMSLEHRLSVPTLSHIRQDLQLSCEDGVLALAFGLMKYADWLLEVALEP